MLHLVTHWPQYANSKNLPQAIDYAAWVCNRLLHMDSGIALDEIWSKGCNSRSELPCAHVFSYPVYVLDTSLQDGKKIPKWSPWVCLGPLLVFSNSHSTQIPLLLNVAKGRISPQFHFIFDNKFETYHSLTVDELLDKQWARIIQLGWECFMDIDYNENDKPIIPTVSDVINTYSQAKASNHPTNT
jgi:hypothetical protein